MKKLSIFVKVFLVLLVSPSIFGLSDCFIQDQNGFRHKVNAESGVISNDIPFEEKQVIFFGCKSDFDGYGNGICMLRRNFGNGFKVFENARVGEGSEVSNGRVRFERVFENINSGYGNEYCIVSIQSVRESFHYKHSDHGSWILSEFIPGRRFSDAKNNWVRDRFLK